MLLEGLGLLPKMRTLRVFEAPKELCLTRQMSVVLSLEDVTDTNLRVIGA
jgi:hypothetical protein